MSNNDQHWTFKRESRKHPRYPIIADVTVVLDDEEFSTVTADISQSGCQLRKPIPDYFQASKLLLVKLKYENTEGKVFTAEVEALIIDAKKVHLKFKTQTPVIDFLDQVLDQGAA